MVIRELDNSEADIRTTSAWILGKASQNNALVQNQAIIELLFQLNNNYHLFIYSFVSLKLLQPENSFHTEI